MQHVVRDARQLNANDIGQLRHLLPIGIRIADPNRSRSMTMEAAINPTTSTSRNSSTTSSVTDQNRISSLWSTTSSLLRSLPNNLRIQPIQGQQFRRGVSMSDNNNNSDSTLQQTIGSNSNANAQYFRMNNLFRCVTSRSQQTDSNRQEARLRHLIRRSRRTLASSNTQNER